MAPYVNYNIWSNFILCGAPTCMAKSLIFGGTHSAEYDLETLQMGNPIAWLLISSVLGGGKDQDNHSTRILTISKEE